MYVGPETGTRRYEDECFEVQRQENDEWIHDAYTSYYGDKLNEGLVLFLIIVLSGPIGG